jgi:hypothetical protein
MRRCVIVHALPIFILVTLVITDCPGQTPDQSGDQVWEVGGRRWTGEEEERYARWVEENVGEDFFFRYRIPADCADVVYGIRWIYARIAHLPAAATTWDGRWIGHWSMDWKHLPTDPVWHQDRRFRAALADLLSKTWTGTLPRDTYPVRISRDSIKPGTVFFQTETHAGLIGRVYLDGTQAHPLLAWESALPVKAQKLTQRSFFLFKPDPGARSGLVKFRWPVLEEEQWRYYPAEEHPFFSEEQYTPGFSKGFADFPEAVARRIDPTDYDPGEKAAKLIATITRLLEERVPAVQAGFQRCRKGGCPEDSEAWEIHHTTGKDEMIVVLMDTLSRIIESNRVDKAAMKKKMESTVIGVSKKQSVTLYQVFQSRPWFSRHPGDSIEARWGLKKCEMVLSQIAATKNSIAFIEKTYRKRDPKFADFSVRQQQHVLKGLGDELARCECKAPPLPRKKQGKK